MMMTLKEMQMKALKHHGFNAQINKLYEEYGEFLFSLAQYKFIRDIGHEESEDRISFEDELADLENMLDQVKIYFEVDENELEVRKRNKMKRHMRMIRGESG